jgi:hypothetical protein
MKLRFYAREDLPVRYPGHIPRTGSPDNYIGREFAPPYRAKREAFECDSESECGRRLMKLTRRDGSLWPADEETAKACGVEFQDVEFNEGKWVLSEGAE